MILPRDFCLFLLVVLVVICTGYSIAYPISNSIFFLYQFFLTMFTPLTWPLCLYLLFTPFCFPIAYLFVYPGKNVFDDSFRYTSLGYSFMTLLSTSLKDNSVGCPFDNSYLVNPAATLLLQNAYSYFLYNSCCQLMPAIPQDALPRR